MPMYAVRRVVGGWRVVETTKPHESLSGVLGLRDAVREARRLGMLAQVRELAAKGDC